jgi:Helix-turn-helix
LLSAARAASPTASASFRCLSFDVRQIRSYEAGEQQPLLSVAVAIADALGISVAELAGKPSHQIQLSGQ